MIKRLVLLLVAVALIGVVNAQHKVLIYGQPALLEGKLLRIKSLHPNPELADEVQIAVTLNDQISVDGEEGLVKTQLIQLIDTDSERYKQYFKHEGRQVKVQCLELFRAHTGHHTTKVLCSVNAVEYP